MESRARFSQGMSSEGKIISALSTVSHVVWRDSICVIIVTEIRGEKKKCAVLNYSRSPLSIISTAYPITAFQWRPFNPEIFMYRVFRLRAPYFAALAGVLRKATKAKNASPRRSCGASIRILAVPR